VTATATREKPILFADRLVRAIRDGRKTVTRRPMRPQPEYFKQYPHWRWKAAWHRKCNVGPFAIDSGDRPGIFGEYVPGDLLYVRECWGPRMENGKPHPVQQYVKYRADFADDSPPADGMDWHTYEDKWRPSIHMPKWAARLWLEIVSVRVDRIQDITGDDCLLEGIEPQGIGSDMAMVAAFQKSWDSIYPGSWDRNDFIWRIEFRNSKGAADA
jgi:hypothetical protein